MPSRQGRPVRVVPDPRGAFRGYTPTCGIALAISWRPVSWLAGHSRTPGLPSRSRSPDCSQWPRVASARHLQLRGQPRLRTTPHRVPDTATIHHYAAINPDARTLACPRGAEPAGISAPTITSLDFTSAAAQSAGSPGATMTAAGYLSATLGLLKFPVAPSACWKGERLRAERRHLAQRFERQPAVPGEAPGRRDLPGPHRKVADDG
jgi:hypothetical protein